MKGLTGCRQCLGMPSTEGTMAQDRVTMLRKNLEPGD